ncbi:MAG: PH domain-containing protein [Limisphaerales bacterium]
MIATVRQFAFALLKLPGQPEPPAGAHASVRVFRAARKFYWLLLGKWLSRQVGVVVGALTGLYFVGQWAANLEGSVGFWIRLAEWVGLAGVLLQMPLTLVLVKFDYEFRWYLVTDRSLRIRWGIWEIREMTMTFANVQQITIQQGPLQRWLGLADVLVRTAGGGGGQEEAGQNSGAHHVMHVGHFHGVDNAAEIRDLILERMRRLRDAGLGDPDDPETSAETQPTPEAGTLLLAEARALVDEARQLRERVTERVAGSGTRR